MSLKKLASLGVIVAVFGFAACSDDSGTTPKKDTGVKTDMAKKDTGVKADMPKPGEMGPGEMGPGPDAAAGACVAEASKLTGTWGGKSIVQIVGEQSACLLDPSTAEACVAAAVKTAVNSEISDPCISCFAKSATCTIYVAKCAICVTAPTGTECTACRCGDNTDKVNCVQQFVDCAGVPSSTQCP